MSVTAITSTEDFEQRLAAASGLVVVDFFATWCGPCKRIAPELAKMAASETSVVFLKVDVDDCEELAIKYDVSAMPTFLFFKNGEKITEVVGANLANITQTVNSNK